MDGKRILLVDDNENITTTLGSILRGDGYLVETAALGREALNKAGDTRFDLAVIDINLPDMRGDAVAADLRKRDRDIKIVLITGYVSLTESIDALDIGISEILLKPIEPDEILRVVRESFD